MTHFEDVFDIIAAGLEPKPSPQTYDRFLSRHGVDPTKAAMFEDLARNLSVPHALGMTTILVVPEGTREVFREEWELEGRDADHVDHVTDDLVGFLETISDREQAARDQGEPVQLRGASSTDPDTSAIPTPTRRSANMRTGSAIAPCAQPS